MRSRSSAPKSAATAGLLLLVRVLSTFVVLANGLVPLLLASQAVVCRAVAGVQNSLERRSQLRYSGHRLAQDLGSRMLHWRSNGYIVGERPNIYKVVL